jgi:GNAT superfamily N-acetyltransferase
MPLAEAAGHTVGQVLLDAAGVEIARFREEARDNRRVADLFTLAPEVSPRQAVPVVMTELRGWQVDAEEPLGRLLVAAGGRAGRHVHVMSRDLVRDPAPPAWLEPTLPEEMRLTAMDRPAAELAPVCQLAYPREHPDFAHVPMPGPRELELELELETIVSGRLLGPLLRCSSLALGDDGAVLGAVLVNGMSGEPPTSGPWITQIFRHPHARGTGGALLRRALALATRDGLPALGLAVTHGNQALALYEAHGFVEVLEALNVDV